MYGWSKWLVALAIGAALVGVPAAEAATVKPMTPASHKLVVVKKHKVKHPKKNLKKNLKKSTVHKTVKKKTITASAVKGKKVTALAKGTIKNSAIKWHHPQLHGA